VIPASVDAHQHFWDPALADYPWMTADMRSIARRFGPDDLEPLLAQARIGQTILVQARSSLDETREFLATAASTEFVAGVVGWVDLTDPAVGETIEVLQSGPGGSFLVGIRHPVHDEPDPHWLIRQDVRRGLAAVASAGLTYDLLVRPRELPAALETVQAIPELRFVVDHLAKPAIRGGRLEPWGSLVRLLAALPNTWCKLSGLVTEADWTRGRVADLEPFVDHALQTFGPERLLFGSDWPVCLLAASYPEVVAAARQLTGSLTGPERARIFGETARLVYRLDERAG
jgi:L-fuconolactonase